MPTPDTIKKSVERFEEHRETWDKAFKGELHRGVHLDYGLD
jgi:hypothetical protein